MNDILLSDASFSEVLARVAYRLIERRLVRIGNADAPDAEILSRLYRQLDRAGWSALSLWVASYTIQLGKGELPSFVRSQFIMRARLGYDFRHVAYFDYKATRRGDPRVTNRGVTGKATKGGR